VKASARRRYRAPSPPFLRIRGWLAGAGRGVHAVRGRGDPGLCPFIGETRNPRPPSWSIVGETTARGPYSGPFCADPGVAHRRRGRGWRRGARPDSASCPTGEGVIRVLHRGAQQAVLRLLREPLRQTAAGATLAGCRAEARVPPGHSVSCAGKQWQWPARVDRRTPNQQFQRQDPRKSPRRP